MRLIGLKEEVSSSSGPLVDLLESVVRRNEPVPWERLDTTEFSSFQERVLRATAVIPWGERRSYGEVADDVGSPRAAQAVGQALGDNPFPLLIPCHRVVRSDGTLGGYQHQSTNDLKRDLLERESNPRSTPVAN